MSIRLQSGEKLVCRLYPHPLIFWHIYLAWTCYLLIGVLFFLHENETIILPLSFHEVGDLLWWEAVLLPAAITAALKRSWLLLFVLSFQGFAAFVLPVWMSFADQNQLLVIFGLSGALAAELYRRSHRYYITSRRLIIESGYFSVKRRTLLYKRIDDVAIKQSLLGRIFNFGSIIPIMASAPLSIDSFGSLKSPFGDGLSGGSGAGEIKDPRLRRDLQLDGVHDPDLVQEAILSRMYEDE